MRVHMHACCWGLACFACMHELSICVCGCNADTWSLSTRRRFSLCNNSGYECLFKNRWLRVLVCLPQHLPLLQYGCMHILGKVVRRILLCAGTRGHHITSTRSYTCKANYILLYHILKLIFNWCKLIIRN